MIVTRTSPFTGKEHTMDIEATPAQIQAYNNGAHLQQAFPHLSPEIREFIHSGITPEEWDEYVKDDEECKEEEQEDDYVERDNEAHHELMVSENTYIDMLYNLTPEEAKELEEWELAGHKERLKEDQSL